jgi:hypothetical protein
MDWSTLAAAFIGGIVGGGIAGAVSFMQLRSEKAQALQARRWIDAEVVADAKSLLMDLDPQRRTINVNPAPGVEAALWKDLHQRHDQLYRQLLMLAAGHPSREVAAAANELGLALLWTAQHSEFAVSELLASRINLKLIEAAQERQATAQEAAEKLAIAIKDAAVPRRRLFLKRGPAQLRDSASSS